MLFADDLLPEEKEPCNQEFITQLHQVCTQDSRICLLPLPETRPARAIANVRHRLLDFAQSSQADFNDAHSSRPEQEKLKAQVELAQKKAPFFKHKKCFWLKSTHQLLLFSTLLALLLSRQQ